MEITFYIVIAVIGFSALMYFVMIAVFFYGWIKMPEFSLQKKEDNHTTVSVIVAARNEENNILTCLSTLSAQDYPSDLYEIIIVDDNSDDNTLGVCEEFINKNSINNIRLIKLAEYNRMSKKEAVKCGVEHAKAQLILTTDADCSVGKSWVSNMAAYYQKYKPKMICGPVTYEKKTGLFHQFQLLDFLSMIISGAGAVSMKKSFMGNAANMAFEKDAFLEVSTDKYDAAFASGDDVFLMHKFKEKYKNSISFIKSKQAIVFTTPQKTIKELILQRVRWASKSKGYKDGHALFFTLNILIFNLMIVFTFFAGLLNCYFFILFFSLFVFKSLVDFPLIYNISRFNNRKDILLHYLWIQLVYPFYIVATATVSLFWKNYLWKGRRYY